MSLAFEIMLWHVVFRKPFLALTFDAGGREARSRSARGWDFLFYALFGIVVTSFVQIGGVLLVLCALAARLRRSRDS